MPGCIVEHIGIVVKDLDQSLGLFEKLTGARRGGVREMPEVGMRVASLEADNIRIELIQYTTGSDGFGKKVMGAAPGYNHISIQVVNMKAALEAWSARGARVMDGFPRPGSHGRVAFFEPESTGGLLLEICEA